MEFHMDMVRERAASADVETLDATTRIQVFGSPSGGVLEMLRVQAVRQAMTGRGFFALTQAFFGISPALLYLVGGVEIHSRRAAGVGGRAVVYLIPRMSDVTDGAARIDGHDVRDLTLASIAGICGVVTPREAPLPRLG